MTQMIQNLLDFSVIIKNIAIILTINLITVLLIHSSMFELNISAGKSSRKSIPFQL